MSKQSVREAFDGSVACTAPPVSCQSSHVSTVPKHSSPRSARGRSAGSWSSIQRILVPEKYASTTSPVFRRISGSAPSAFSRSQSAAVRRHCHTMALPTGRPDARSQRMVVSRWLVMPTAAISAGVIPAAATAWPRACTVVAQICPGSCSTQPGCG